MKTKTYIITLLLAIAAASACTREKMEPAAETASVAVENGSQVLVPFTVEAGEPQTRVAMAGSTTNIVFSAGDQLMVYCWKIVEPSILTLQSGDGQRSATFSGNLILAEGKTEADLAGKTLLASLIPQDGVSQGVFSYDPSEKRLTVDYSANSIDSDLEALFRRTAVYQGSTRYEDKKFKFELLTSYVKMNVTVPSEESSLARDYTVAVTYDYHIRSKASNSGMGWGGENEAATVNGTFCASTATGGTAYMAILAASSMRIEDDSVQYDEVDFSIAMDNVYKEYDLVGGSISKAVIPPGKGITKSVTLRDNPIQDVLLGQPESVRNRIMSTYHYDLNHNGYLSKYEAAQIKSCKMYGNDDLTDASFYGFFKGMTTFEEETLVSCVNMTKVILPKYITEIGNSAFEGCSKLGSVIIPSGVTSLGNHAFYTCTNLSRIIIPSSVTTIGDYAFKSCSKLTEVIFESPVRVESIGESAFSKCSSLEGFAVPDKMTTIEKKTFEDCTSLKTVANTVNVASIGEYAFFNCTALGEIRVPRVTSIGKYAFALATSLQSVYLPTFLFSSIEEGTFDTCTSLVNITLPASLETIGDSAFKECDALTTLAIPASVKSIGVRAIYECDNLTTIYCYPTTPPSIRSESIYVCPNLTTIYVPNRDAYWGTNWSNWHWSIIKQM